MKHLAIMVILPCFGISFAGSIHAQTPTPDHDPVADNMLVYQRSVGGWPKHIGNTKIDYTVPLSPAQIAAIRDDAGSNDATIDNDATSKEIRYLVKAYKHTGNKNYLQAVERGIRYLLVMQYKNGGFPQFYPDFSLYRSEITYNDNAMVNALNILDDVALGMGDLEVVNPALRAPATDAVSRGITCILNTQIKVNGQLTAWCAQYDRRTLEPAKARSYELPSLSGNESVGIVEFLLRIPHPSQAIQDAINSAVEWFNKVKIEGYEFVFVADPNQPDGKDRVFRPSPGNVIWARFYDIKTNEPFFCGRDGIRKKTVAEIEHERRVGYGWYGQWPERLLEKDYPAWKAKLTSSTDQPSHVKTAQAATPNQPSALIVDGSGHGNFTSIQAAINSLSDNSPIPRVIFIRKGIYNEKVSITKNNIVLKGEDKEGTILTWSLARDAWRCDHADDWGVATMNLRGTDITLDNLTIVNSYGFDHREDTTIACGGDSLTHQKKVSRNGHQMALRSFETTRLRVMHCILKAYGGDTVSPWNVTGGFFYFSDCIMEGGVDFYCPRGWAYAERCQFIADNGPACIWHDGSADPDSKTVLDHCSFTGYDGFKLGRYHRDAQFFLLHCNFAANMADDDIYRVPTNNIIQWGHRVYYYDCHKTGKPYHWYADNLAGLTNIPAPSTLDANWVFKGKWDPYPASRIAIGLAATVMDKQKDQPLLKWTYEQGVFWQGLEGLGQLTKDEHYPQFIQSCVDQLVDNNGNILTYKQEDYNLDNILSGRSLLYLYQRTKEERYRKAASHLWQQLSQQPRTKEGSFWHKQRYPSQVWLDGLYMAQPFYAAYAAISDKDSVWGDICRQFEAINQHTLDPATGLLYHGWDESRQERWADKQSGHSPNCWGRAMGWYGMALVDVLDHFPATQPGRDSLEQLLQHYASAIEHAQDSITGLWWDVLDKPNAPGNFPEASASCMFVYVLAKGVRMGYLPSSCLMTALKGYQGILQHFIQMQPDGTVNLDGTVAVSGLGGSPYRDGSYDYYIHERTASNDLKGVGAFLLAAVEIERSGK